MSGYWMFISILVMIACNICLVVNVRTRGDGGVSIVAMVLGITLTCVLVLYCLPRAAHLDSVTTTTTIGHYSNPFSWFVIGELIFFLGPVRMWLTPKPKKGGKLDPPPRRRRSSNVPGKRRR